MKFEALAEFKVDVKSLLKKYRTLEDDLAVVKKVLQVLPDERPPFSGENAHIDPSVALQTDHPKLLFF